MKKINLLLSLLLLFALLLSGCRNTEAPEESTAESEDIGNSMTTGEESVSETPEEFIRNFLKTLSGMEASDISQIIPSPTKLTNEEIVRVMSTVSPEFLTLEEGQKLGYEMERFDLFDFWRLELIIEKDGQSWPIRFGCSLPENLVRIYFRTPDQGERYDFFIQNEGLFNMVRYQGMTEEDQYNINDEDYRRVMENPVYQSVGEKVKDMLNSHSENDELTTFYLARTYEANGYTIEIYDIDLRYVYDEDELNEVIHETYPSDFFGGMQFDPWYRVKGWYLEGPIAVQLQDGKVINSAFLCSDGGETSINENTYKDMIDYVFYQLNHSEESSQE